MNFGNRQLCPQVLSLKESATLAINQEALRKRAAGEEVCHLGFGQSPFPVHPLISDSLRNNAHRNIYLPTQGLPELRKTLADHLQKRGSAFEAGDIFVGPGSKELIFDFLLLLDGPLYIPAPSWVSYGPQAQLLKKPIQVIPTERADDYKVTPKKLEESAHLVDSRTQKLLILNSPSNPTGVVYQREEMQALVPVLRKHNFVVLSDEIYREIYFGDSLPASFAEVYPEATFVTGGLSKAFSAGGYRLGFIALPEGSAQLRSAFTSLASETFSSVAAPVQYAAAVAFSDSPEMNARSELCRNIHRACSLYLWKGFCDLGMNCPRPDGAFYLFPGLENFAPQLSSKGIQSAAQMCDYLLENHGLAVLPGTDFYTPQDALTFRAAHVDYDGAAVLAAAETAASLDDAFVEAHCPNLPRALAYFKDFLGTLLP